MGGARPRRQRPGALHRRSPPAGVTRVSRAGTGWTGQPLQLEAGAADALVASDGRTAAAAYRLRPPPAVAAARGDRCRLALLDPAAGAVGPGHTVCGSGEEVLSVAVTTSGGGGTGAPTTYLGLVRVDRESAARPEGAGAGGRVVAVDPATGRALRAAPLDGVPTRLVLLPAAAGASPRLVCVCGPPDAGRAEAAERWRAVILGADTLALEAITDLPVVPHALAAAPDGAAAYALAGGLDAGSRPTLLQLHPGGGAQRLVDLPGRAIDLAVGAEAIYVPHLDGSVIWVIGRRGGAIVGAIPVGHRPVAVAIASGALGGPPE